MKLTAYQRRQVDYVKANMPGMVTRQHKGMSLGRREGSQGRRRPEGHGLA